MSNFFFHLERPKELQELSQCFNQMTEELAGTQLLRADFVRNFSHEFKTPIVSILGVAKLLKNQELEPAQSQEYLNMIIKESQRLSQLSAALAFGLPFSVFLFVVPLEALLDVHQNVRVFL